MANEVYKDDANLEGLWLMEETSGTRYDAGPNGNDLADNNTVLYSTDHQEGANSADFESSNSEYLSITDAAQVGLALDVPLSIVFWAKPESDGATRYPVLKGEGTDLSYRVGINSSNHLRLRLSTNGTSETTATGGSSITAAGGWVHCAVVADGTDIRLYVDASLDNTPTSFTGTLNDSADDFKVGGYGGLYWDGLLDEVAVFSRALSALEVASIYANGIQDPPGGAILLPQNHPKIYSLLRR